MRAVKHYEAWREGSDVGEVGTIVEDLGFDGFAMSDHPYPDKEWLSRGGHHAFDPFAALAFVAARTSRIKLLTYILVNGYRSPYVSAKALGTIDVLSQGRVVVGMGAGYLRSEFDVVGADFTRRGALLDEAIPAMRAAWSGTDHKGQNFPAEGHEMLPAPIQVGGPPIWIGGNSPAAQRRAVSLAEGWIPMGITKEVAEITRTDPLETTEALRALVGPLQERRADEGNPPLEIAFTPFEVDLLRTDAAEYAERVSDRLDDYAAAGVTQITIEPASRSLSDLRSDLQAISSRLLASGQSPAAFGPRSAARADAGLDSPGRQ